MLDKKHVGLSLGIFFALIHAIWALIVAFGYGQALLDWILSMHSMTAVLVVGAMTLGRALGLIALSFVFGYVLGWLFAAVWNTFGGKKKRR